MDQAELAYAGIARQADLIRAGEVSSRELVDLYLERIERIDPRLNSFRVVLGERARAEADEADRRVAAGESAPLLGVPIALKDEVDVEGELTTHGTAGFDRPARADAAQYRRLREAGAVLIGKTNLSDLAIWPFTETEPWGETRNPWDPGRTPGGSSGGSGAAVAAGLVGAASASDGGGSIRIPASYCGLFGLKPQRGRISLAPEPEHWLGLSVTGCLTRRVADTALWLDVTAGPEPGDADIPPPPERSYADAAAAPPGKLRIAWSVSTPRALAPPIVSDEVVDAVGEAGRLLASLGHSVEERDPDWGWIGNEISARYLAGIADHGTHVDRPERLEPRTRGMLRIGGALPACPDRAVAQHGGGARAAGQSDLRGLRRPDHPGHRDPRPRDRPLGREGRAPHAARRLARVPLLDPLELHGPAGGLDPAPARGARAGRRAPSR